MFKSWCNGMNKTNRTNKKAITLKTIDTELDLGISFASEQLSCNSTSLYTYSGFDSSDMFLFDSLLEILL